MRKKISLLLLAFICALSFVGCASKEDAEQDVSTMTAVNDSLVVFFSSMGEEDIELYYEQDDFDLSIMMYSYSIPADGETFVSILEAWQTGMDDCGEFQDMGEWEVEVSGDEVTLTADATYSERNATITFIYEDGRIDSLTIDPVYTFNEIIQKAILNTLLGMGTVFAVLIFIAFIISLFKYIPMLEEKFKKKSAATPAVEAAPVAAPVVEVVDEYADLDLIAVITAAIAASEGTTTDGFVVRSIKRKKSNKWNA